MGVLLLFLVDGVCCFLLEEGGRLHGMKVTDHFAKTHMKVQRGKKRYRIFQRSTGRFDI